MASHDPSPSHDGAQVPHVCTQLTSHVASSGYTLRQTPPQLAGQEPQVSPGNVTGAVLCAATVPLSPSPRWVSNEVTSRSVRSSFSLRMMAPSGRGGEGGTSIERSTPTLTRHPAGSAALVGPHAKTRRHKEADVALRVSA